jgi:hypothetical protein
MMNSNRQVQSCVAGVVVILLSLPVEQMAAALPQQETPTPAAQAAPTQQQSATSTQDLPQDSNAGAEKKTPPATGSKAPNSGTSAATPSQSTNQEQQQNEPAKPVGTAAAPYEKTTGVAASRPAGAVIAPAKQRRVRTFLIRMGVVIGAAAAVGTVAALSHASPSRPH